MDAELNTRIKAFHTYSDEESVDDLKHFLYCPLKKLNLNEIKELYGKQITFSKNVIAGSVQKGWVSHPANL